MLTKMSFINTQLDKEHLALLGSLISWVNPAQLDLKLNHNELDDLDVEDFILDRLLKSGINL